jgi:hypothetical protein
LVGFYNYLPFGGYGQDGYLFTAGELSHKRLLGIDMGGIAEIGWGGRRGHRMAAVKAPGMIARIFLVRKFGAAARPLQAHIVL